MELQHQSVAHVQPQRPTSFWGSPRAIISWSSFCSSLRAPMDCWLRAKSDSSFSPASVKYFEKCSQLRLLAGKSSCLGKKTCPTNPRSCDSSRSDDAYHQPVVHANFTETAGDRVYVFLRDPRLEQLDSEGCGDSCGERGTGQNVCRLAKRKSGKVAEPHLL